MGIEFIKRRQFLPFGNLAKKRGLLPLDPSITPSAQTAAAALEYITAPNCQSQNCKKMTIWLRNWAICFVST